MSHELRTPLHGILSFASFGIKRSKDVEIEKIINYFSKIRDSGEVLLKILNDSFDLQKLESGMMVFQFSNCKIHQLIQKVIDNTSSLAAEKEITLEFSKPKIYIVVYVDSERLMQVIRNRLSNAIKFSHSGSTIDIDIVSDKDKVKVSISDQGPGVPKEELEIVFDKFIQSSVTETGAGGTGLGLSIYREIIIVHEGLIWAENNDNCGTKFSFAIPLIKNS